MKASTMLTTLATTLLVATTLSAQIGEDPREKIREDAALYDKVDAVLDKISAEGMSSLSPAELKLLDEVSKKHRTN